MLSRTIAIASYAAAAFFAGYAALLALHAL